MARVLSKYSKAKNQQVEYTTQIEYAKALAKNAQAAPPDDYETPFTFQEWYNRNYGIAPGEEYRQYNEYLRRWYEGRYTPTEAAESLKEEYLALIKQLAVVLQNEDEYKWVADIDYTDDLEIADVIPFFATKLKEIAIYLANKRSAIKKAKLKYNMSGAHNAISSLFYEYLLKAFTKRDYTLNVPVQSAWNTFPELSAIKDTFKIQIQELYDNTNYFDKNPVIPASSYFDFSHSYVSGYYDTLNYDTSSLDWMFHTGFSQLCAESPLIWTLSGLLARYNATELAQLPLSAFIDSKRSELNDYWRIRLTEKYLGHDQYFMEGGYYIAPTKTYTYDLQEGNNFFYWPSGEYFREIDSTSLNSIKLSATNLVLNGAQGAKEYQDADKIFVWDIKNDEQGNITINNLSAAWLQTKENQTIVETMSANLANSTRLRFRFPWPGYGLSGDGIPYAGPELSNLVNRIAYLPIESQNEIIDLYWNTTSPQSAFNPISIHDTKLVDNGAYASQNYLNADKISVRLTENSDYIHDTKPDMVYKGQFDRAWLYKFLKTDILVKPGQNYIQWPMRSYTVGETLTPVPTSQCAPLALSSVDVENDIIGARAGHGLYDSDIIYKLDAPDGFSIECAFLSGVSLGTIVPNATGTIQPNFTLKCAPGNYETFIWQDANKQINSTTIHGKKHQPDCPYYQQDQTSIYNARYKTLGELRWTDTGINNYKTCECKAVWYSPIGHPGDTYDEYDKMADIVFVDTQYPEEFDLNTWQGTDGKTYDQSTDFAWYKLTGSPLEVDVGWSPGEWTTGAGTATFSLSEGVRYKYLRANLRRNPEDLFLEAIPPLIIKQTHDSTPKVKWVKALLQDDGTWDKSTDPSDMLIRPGDYIMYDHIDSHWFCTTAAGDYGFTPTRSASSFNLNDSIWTNYDYVTTGIEVKAQWPSSYIDGGPSTLRGELTAVTWQLKEDAVTIYTGTIVTPEEPFVFVPSKEAIYTVQAVGYGVGAPVTVTFATIPAITAVQETLLYQPSGELDIITKYNDRIGMTINIDLSGWNYSTNTYDGTSIGGRPFWAKAYDDSSLQTKFKGIDVWGGSIRSGIIDNYTFLAQPDLATVKLSADSFVDYSRKSTQMVWKEPIQFLVDVQGSDWKKILIDPSANYPGFVGSTSLATYLYNITTDLVITATEIDSDLELYQSTDGTFVNYWANNAFTWVQTLTDTSLGLPPTGGRWIPATSGLLIEAQFPYANLSNRHYPTIATVPYIGGVYSSEESGGYFVPRLLGASTYVGINYDNSLDPLSITNNTSQRGLSAIFQDPNYFRTDRGLSESTQVAPITTADVDARWMKASVVEGEKAGMIVNAQKYQEFIPYQTKYESTNNNSDGLITQKVAYDPFTGEQDNEWNYPNTWPANFRGEYDIQGWYDTLLTPGKKFYQWKTDIFGNNYVLVKETSATSLYDQKRAIGEMWVKDQNGRIDTASNKLSAVYDNFTFSSPALSAQIINNQIRDFDVWFDTLMLYTTGYVVFERLNFDYDTNRIYSIADDLQVLNLSADTGGRFGGTWFFDEDKKVTLCTVQADDDSWYGIPGYSTWVDLSAAARDWDGIDTSSDGQYVGVASTGTGAYIRSADYGATWSDVGSSAQQRDVAISSSGKYQLVVGAGKIQRSDDYGVSLSSVGPSPGSDLYGVDMSSDGKYQTAVGPSIYRSDDYGLTWTNKSISNDWTGIAMSSNGRYQTAVGETVFNTIQYIYRSTNYGNTWTQLTTGPQKRWSAIAMSANGKYQTAVAFGVTIYTSNDYGATWTATGPSSSWTSVAMSDDGRYQTAVGNTGVVYKSDDYGATWSLTTGAPAQYWKAVTMSSDGYYQYIGSTNQKNVYRSTGTSFNSHYYPTLYTLDLNTNEFRRAYNGAGDAQINAISALGLSAIEDPVFTYNNLTNKFSVAFVGYGATYQGMTITDIKINNFSGEMELDSIKSIVPTN